MYTKCKDDFLLGLLVHRTTPLLYTRSKLSPAELFFGRRLASNLPIIHNSNPELVAEHQSIDKPSRTREVNFEPGDSVWVCSSPIENTWKQGVIIHSVVGVPDSLVVKINDQQYRRNKQDITFSPPTDYDGVAGAATGNQHAEEQVGTENKTDRLIETKINIKVPKDSHSSNITFRL